MFRSLDGITAQSILKKCSIYGFVPGLFNAISFEIIGNEHLYTELRVLTTIGMAKTGLKYTDNLGRLYYVSRDYSESFDACAEPGSFSDAWTIAEWSIRIHH